MAKCRSRLFHIFLAVSTCTDARAASAIFYTPRDVNQKLGLIHNAARFVLKGDTESLEKWFALRKRVIDASQVRNALAHFHLEYDTKLDDNWKAESAKPVLNPNYQDVTVEFKKRKSAVQNLDAKAIARHIGDFNTLSADLGEFARDIRHT
jgi:hypothetical protein